MDHVNNDVDAWSIYPRFTSWYNKLWLSERLRYKCGPAGVRVPAKGTYIVRPIYNLLGMGLGAKYMFLSPDYKENQIPPGHFWCEKFEGFHYSRLRMGSLRRCSVGMEAITLLERSEWATVVAIY